MPFLPLKDIRGVSVKTKQPSTPIPCFVLCRIEGEMSPVCLQYPAVDGEGTSISVSVLDKLIHTHPIWLLLSIDQREATGILLQQPARVFLVWKSSILQKKVLSFHMDGTSDSSVIHIPVKENQYNPMLEKAMHKCVLKPLYGCLQSVLHDFQVAGAVCQRLQENLALAKAKQPHELGVNGTRPPDAHAIHRIRRKLRAMCHMYSPERKIMVLLKVCKLIYNIMQDHEVRMFGADDFLPMLTYVLVQCDMPQLDTEILFMMELIDPPLLHGEGGYYLTSAYGAMSLIKNFQEEQAARVLSSTTRDTLHQWHQRRTLQRDLPSVDDFQNYMRVALQKADSGCTAKTLQVRPYATTEEVCRLCALKFRVSDPENYGLFLYTDESSQQLATDTHPQWIKAELHSQPKRQHFYFVYKSIPSMNCSTPLS
uniref:Ras and Rab interactor 2 n=1 Tax=Sinocyclocheilus rhinocerous TaxID=307959 RepID=A0A673LDT6_9TELE